MITVVLLGKTKRSVLGLTGGVKGRWRLRNMNYEKRPSGWLSVRLTSGKTSSSFSPEELHLKQKPRKSFEFAQGSIKLHRHKSSHSHCKYLFCLYVYSISLADPFIAALPYIRIWQVAIHLVQYSHCPLDSSREQIWILVGLFLSWLLKRASTQLFWK